MEIQSMAPRAGKYQRESQAESCAAHQENTRANQLEEQGKGAYSTGLTVWEIVLIGTLQSYWGLLELNNWFREN